MTQPRQNSPATRPAGTLHPAALPESELLKSIRVSRGRDSGPGGQHRNKVETKITLLHEPSGVEAHAGERRSAEENRRVALRRLRLALAIHVRCSPIPRDSFGDVTSDLWRSRCSAKRIACNPEHEDYPALLAEALDVIVASGLDPKRSALRLSCSASQLIRLVKDHPPALDYWNRERASRDLHALK
ncbi:MAG: peptide chain release factor-like protein [Planctomycetes bacterium]|nr:peptide chain release factor-like protein [Planctomycetota bacterium]